MSTAEIIEVTSKIVFFSFCWYGAWQFARMCRAIANFFEKPIVIENNHRVVTRKAETVSQ